MTFKIAGIVAAALCAAVISAQAQTYPTREIRVVVGLPAGILPPVCLTLLIDGSHSTAAPSSAWGD